MEFKHPLKKRSNKKRSIKSKAKFSADSTSRSLSMASRDQLLSRELVCEIQANNRLVIDTSQVINDNKISLSKTAALALANWLIDIYSDCNCGAADIKSARYGRGHLLWCKNLKFQREAKNARVQKSDSNTQETNVVGESESDSRVPSSQVKGERET